MNSANDDVVRRLDVLIRLTAMALFKEKSQKEKIAILDIAGLLPKEIAMFLDTTPNTVSVTLSTMKKEKGQDKGAKKIKRSPENTDV
jgi:hypothetical protein